MGQTAAKKPWTPTALFLNGAGWLLIGAVLISAGDIALVGVAALVVGGVQILIGAIRVGTRIRTTDAAD